jgi:hypothetical protein
MRSHLLGMLESASILQVNRHTGSALGVTPDRGQESRVPRSYANGCPGIVPIQRAPAERASVATPLLGCAQPNHQIHVGDKS